MAILGRAVEKATHPQGGLKPGERGEVVMGGRRVEKATHPQGGLKRSDRNETIMPDTVEKATHPQGGLKHHIDHYRAKGPCG